MADIFGFNQTVGKPGFRDSASGEAALKFEGSPVNLVQNWNIQYTLNVQPIFECGSSKIYFAAKHSNGTMSISRIVAEKPAQLVSKIGTVCDPKTASLTAATGTCNGGVPVTLKMLSTIIASVGFSGQAQNAYVGEDVQCMFAGLESS